MKDSVKEGQEIEVKIENLARKGDGIVKIDGLVIFVPDTLKGERCRIKITRVLETFAFAKKVSDTPQ